MLKTIKLKQLINSRAATGNRNCRLTSQPESRIPTKRKIVNIRHETKTRNKTIIRYAC